MLACNCKGIPETKLREKLAETDGPVSHNKLHRELCGEFTDCCGHCRTPKGNRLFVDIVTEHNAKFTDAGPK